MACCLCVLHLRGRAGQDQVTETSSWQKWVLWRNCWLRQLFGICCFQWPTHSRLDISWSWLDTCKKRKLSSRSLRCWPQGQVWWEYSIFSSVFPSGSQGTWRLLVLFPLSFLSQSQFMFLFSSVCPAKPPQPGHTGYIFNSDGGGLS